MADMQKGFCQHLIRTFLRELAQKKMDVETDGWVGWLPGGSRVYIFKTKVFGFFSLITIFFFQWFIECVA